MDDTWLTLVDLWARSLDIDYRDIGKAFMEIMDEYAMGRYS